MALGRALYLATEFEHKCRYVLQLAQLAKHFKETNDVDAAMELVRSLKDPRLGLIIARIRSMPWFDSDDVDRLERGKDARNFICHEAALLGPLFGVTTKHIEALSIRLRDNVKTLALADNVISQWIYEIEEKEPSPRGILRIYPELATSWILESLAGDNDERLTQQAAEP